MTRADHNPTDILFVAYPMLPVSDASCGGAEQMLWTLEAELARRGRRTIVAACSGSRVSGEVFATGDAPNVTDGFEFRAAEHARQVAKAIEQFRPKLVHDKSGYWWSHAGECSTPILATLHLPRTYYQDHLFHSLPPNVYFNCVSQSQASKFLDLPRMMGVVPNGILLDRFPLKRKKSNYVLWLGRICPEKAPHLAMDAAQRAGVKLVLAGRVYPFSWHQLYFDQEIRPRLERAGESVAWIEAPEFEQKLDLIQNARAVLIPSLAPETSSLVAMEAAACGTPVIAFGNGALPEIVRGGLTGYIVRDVSEMAHAIADVDHLWPEDARQHAEENFAASRMADRYESLYRSIVEEFANASPLAA